MTAGHKETILDQFSRQAESYSRLTRSLASDRSAGLRSVLHPCKDDNLLEVCCGPGLLALDFAPHVGRATGLDLTPAMIEEAKATQAARGADNVEWLIGDVCAIPAGDAVYSIVLCSAAFHHLEAPRAAFAEMARVTRAGGRIVVRDVTPAPEKVAAYDEMEKLRDPSHVHALTLAELSALGCDLGRGIEVSEPSIRTSPTPDLPLDAILATSFPQACTREDLVSRFREDALSCEDRLGFKARLVDGSIFVSYPISTAIWTKH